MTLTAIAPIGGPRTLLTEQLRNLAEGYDIEATQPQRDDSTTAGITRAAKQLRHVASLVNYTALDQPSGHMWLSAGRHVLDQYRAERAARGTR